MTLVCCGATIEEEILGLIIADLIEISSSFDSIVPNAIDS